MKPRKPTARPLPALVGRGAGLKARQQLRVESGGWQLGKVTRPAHVGSLRIDGAATQHPPVASTGLGFEVLTGVEELVAQTLKAHQRTASPEVLGRIVEESHKLDPESPASGVALATHLALENHHVRQEQQVYAGRQPTEAALHTLELEDVGRKIVAMQTKDALPAVVAAKVERELYRLESQLQREALIGFNPREGGWSFAIDGSSTETAAAVAQRFAELWARHAKTPTQPEVVTLAAESVEALHEALGRSKGKVLHLTGLESGSREVLSALGPHLEAAHGERLLLLSGKPDGLRQALELEPFLAHRVQARLLQLS